MIEKLNPPLPPVRTVGPVSLSNMVRYQGASGDFNPLHHDVEFAQSAGFDRPVIVGMYMAGLMSSWMVDGFGPESVRRLRTRFRRPAFVGDVLEVGGIIEETTTVAQGIETQLSLWCRRASDNVEVATGWATCLRESGDQSG